MPFSGFFDELNNDQHLIETNKKNIYINVLTVTLFQFTKFTAPNISSLLFKVIQLNNMSKLYPVVWMNMLYVYMYIKTRYRARFLLQYPLLISLTLLNIKLFPISNLSNISANCFSLRQRYCQVYKLQNQL